MHVVIKLGGVNGSGKTTLARAVLAAAGAERLKMRSRRESAYLGWYSNHRVVVLGSYENTCGGMDTISDKEDRLALLKRECQKGSIVFYEGLITGKTYGKMGEMCEAQEAKGAKWIWAFMNTSFEECHRRVLQRRHAKGNMAEFDPERTMRSTYDSCVRLEQKLRDGTLPAPHMVYTVQGTGKPVTEAKKLLDHAVEALT